MVQVQSYMWAKMEAARTVVGGIHVPTQKETSFLYPKSPETYNLAFIEWLYKQCPKLWCREGYTT